MKYSNMTTQKKTTELKFQSVMLTPPEFKKKNMNFLFTAQNNNKAEMGGLVSQNHW